MYSSIVDLYLSYYRLQVKYIITVGANALVDLNPTNYNVKWTFARWIIQYTASWSWRQITYKKKKKKKESLAGPGYMIHTSQQHVCYNYRPLTN